MKPHIDDPEGDEFCKEVNEYIADLHRELDELREWKEKAKPFIQAEYENLEECLTFRKLAFKDAYKDVCEDLQILKKLLNVNEN